MKTFIQKIAHLFGYHISKYKPESHEKLVVGTRNQNNREAWLQKQLAGIPQGAKILDAGAGELQYKKYCTHLDYISQDFCQYTGKGDGKAKQRKNWDTSQIDIVSDITSIPEIDNSIDAIMCIEVLEHLPSPINALEEFNRLLQKNGILIITAPFASLTHFSPYHYYSGFSSNFYEYHLKQAGFSIEEMVPNGNFFEFMAQEIRRINEVSRKYCNYTISENESMIIRKTLSLLQSLTKNDTKSSELMCFGYHIRAKKG